MRRFSGLARVIVGAAAIIAVYYVVPMNTHRGFGMRIALTALALTVLAMVITRHVRRGSDPVARLVLILVAAVATLALGFYSTASMPGQFTGLSTRTDALYFTVITMTTIGYGDIHPTGQLARALVIGAVVFQVGFIAALVHTIGSRLMRGGGAPST